MYLYCMAYDIQKCNTFINNRTKRGGLVKLSWANKEITTNGKQIQRKNPNEEFQKKILKKLICEKPREITMKIMPKNVVPKNH